MKHKINVKGVVKGDCVEKCVASGCVDNFEQRA